MLRQSSTHTWRETPRVSMLSACMRPAFYAIGADEQTKPNLGARWRC